MKRSITHIRTIALFLFIVVIAGYVLFQTRNLIYGPVIVINSPQNGAAVSESLISIDGVAKNISFINLNGGQIFVDEEGKFNQQLLLSRGYNIMTLQAQDKFGRETSKTLELIYENQ